MDVVELELVVVVEDDDGFESAVVLLLLVVIVECVLVEVVAEGLESDDSD